MQIEYAKELVAVDCQRIIEILKVLDVNSNELTNEQVLAKNRLQVAAEEAIGLFKHKEA